jgi:Na+-translocating ferredoxin:NAD+ oxidoreductase RNF subunit RnfB
MAISNKDKLKQIYDILPQLNCGLCGYDNCGQFAKAVSEKEVGELLKGIDNILNRIENLGKKKA